MVSVELVMTSVLKSPAIANAARAQRKINSDAAFFILIALSTRDYATELITVLLETDKTVSGRISTCDRNICRTSDNHVINNIRRRCVESGCAKDVDWCATRKFRDRHDAAGAYEIVLCKIADHHELIPMDTGKRVSHSVSWNNHAFEIVGESCSSKSAYTERENSKKISHEPGECDVSKHDILNMRSRLMSSSALTFPHIPEPKQIDPLSRIC